MQIQDYDYYIIAFSGGKDSIACFLHLLEIGIPKSKIELWHHKIDGSEGSTLMDWPVTEDYCRKFAEAFEVPIYFSWKEGGFEGELLRENSRTKPNHFEYPDDNIIECGFEGGKIGKLTTRRKFPQVSADLNVRWCSAYLKIDVCTMAIRNQKRFNNKKTLLITGERTEESTARAKYKVFEPDRADRRDGKLKRHVDHWRPVHSWLECRIWEIMERWKIIPHPAYLLGWNRLSCMFCIFGNADQWKSAAEINPKGVKKIITYEKEFGFSIKRNLYLPELLKKGNSYLDRFSIIELLDINLAMSKIYTRGIFTNNWKTPKGAYKKDGGPT